MILTCFVSVSLVCLRTIILSAWPVLWVVRPGGLSPAASAPAETLSTWRTVVFHQNNSAAHTRELTTLTPGEMSLMMIMIKMIVFSGTWTPLSPESLMRLLVRSSAPSLNSFLAAALHSTPGTTTDQSEDITNLTNLTNQRESVLHLWRWSNVGKIWSSAE